MENSLSVKLSYTDNIALKEFLDYLSKIEQSYNKHTGKSTELFIYEINKGSIELIFMVASVANQVFNELSKELLIEFGKYVIDSIRKAKNHSREIAEGIKINNPISIQEAKNIQNITGNYNTVNNVYVEIKADGKVKDSEEITKLQMKEAYDVIGPALHTVGEDGPKDPDEYESVTLKFSTVSDLTKDTFSGRIKDIDKKPKKITFFNDTVKDSFDFQAEPFNKAYLVDVRVHYNKNNSIAKYEILNNIQTL